MAILKPLNPAPTTCRDHLVINSNIVDDLSFLYPVVPGSEYTVCFAEDIICKCLCIDLDEMSCYDFSFISNVRLIFSASSLGQFLRAFARVFARNLSYYALALRIRDVCLSLSLEIEQVRSLRAVSFQTVLTTAGEHYMAALLLSRRAV